MGKNKLYEYKQKKIKIAIILAYNAESSIRLLSEDIVTYQPNMFSIDIFSMKYNSRFSTDNIKPLYKHLGELKSYDIFHLQAALPISLAMGFRILFPRACLLSTEHDFGWKYFRKTLPLYKSLLLRLLLYCGRKSCHLNTFPSYSLFQDVTGLSEVNSHFAVVHNGIQDQFSFLDNPDYLSKSSSNKKIVVVGNYYFSKGIDLMLSIVEELEEIEFHFFGNVFNGLSKQKYKSIENLVKRDNVYIYGKVDRFLLLEFLYQEKCVVCIPSRSESFCLVALEAMASKHPIVISNIPVFHEIADEKFSIMFDLENIKSLKKAVLQAFNRYDYLAPNARVMYLNHFTVDKMVNGYYKLYNERKP